MSYYDYDLQRMLSLISDYANDTFELHGFDAKISMGTYVEPSTIIRTFYQQGFFRMFSQKTMTHLFPILSKIKNVEQIIGLILGLSINDNSMIRKALSDIFGKDVKKNYLDGVFGILYNDTSLEKEIKDVALLVGMDPYLALDTVELLNKKNHNVYANAYSICEEWCTNPQIASTIVAMIKGDFSSNQVISDVLGLDVESLTGVLACAKGKVEILGDFYEKLSTQLDIGNHIAIKSIIGIINGQKEDIKEIISKSDQFFNLDKPEVVEAVVYLTRRGRQLKD